VIRVFVVEDHAILREGLSNLLGLCNDISVVGMASSAEDALAALPSLACDVLLLDIKLPGISGVELVDRLRAVNKLPPTLFLTTFDDDALLMEGLRAGAKGYLLKDVGLEQLLAAIREVASGGSHINPAASDRLLRATLKRDDAFEQADEPAALTARETDVLRLMANGFSNYEIAQALSVTEGTIKNHVSNVLSKLGVRDRTRAVLIGLQNRLI
jgi:DNA-binding NarL/FixJ family response regulator